MARPTKAKEPKPKAEGSGDGKSNALGGFTGIIINAVLTTVLMVVFIGANYWMVNTIVNSKGGGEEVANEEGGQTGGEGIESAMTFPYDLDDFIINLSNPAERRYLKVKISLDVTREDGEPEIGEAPSPAKEGGHGGGEGGGPDPKAFYSAVMEPFKMPIRDVIISKLSSLSAEELSSVTGKQQAKDSIKEEINTILPETRQVQRVNFGEFIIQ